MISRKMQDKLNEQLKKELYSSYLYLAMSVSAKAISLDGFAKWLRLQADEEREHGMKIFDYLEEQQAEVKLATIEEPPGQYKSMLDVFEKTLAHEKYVTQSINELMMLAVEEKDFATQAFLQWFITEQVEEESEAQTMVDKLRMVGESVGGLFQLDRHAGERASE